MLTASGPARVDDGRYGIDRLSLSFPVADVFDETDWDQASYGRGGSQTLMRSVVDDDPDNAGAAVMVGTKLIDGMVWGKVEANPARLRDPQGCSLLPVDEFDSAACAMWAVASMFVRPAVDLAGAKVRRLDLARDFRGVAQPGFFVRGLMNVKRPYARRVQLHSDPARGNAETLFAGSGAGGVRLYDQHEAYADRGAPEGSLRWEVEARKEWLGAHGIERVESVDPMRLEALALQRWEWSKMGTEVTGACNVVERVQGWVRAAKLSQAKADRLIGQLLRDSLGVAGKVSNDTASEYNRLKAELGVVPSAELFAGYGADMTVRSRLDWDQGVELAA